MKKTLVELVSTGGFFYISAPLCLNKLLGAIEALLNRLLINPRP